jgi:hypothetical protein
MRPDIDLPVYSDIRLTPISEPSENPKMLGFKISEVRFYWMNEDFGIWKLG